MGRGKARVETIKASDIWKMLEAQMYKCALSGRDLTPEEAAMDHKTPIGRDGLHDVSNVWIVHQDVNLAKGTMTAEEFIRLCRDVVAWADRPQ